MQSGLYTGFECDVRMSGDNTLVVVHDSTLRRTHHPAVLPLCKRTSWTSLTYRRCQRSWRNSEARVSGVWEEPTSVSVRGRVTTRRGTAGK